MRGDSGGISNPRLNNSLLDKQTKGEGGGIIPPPDVSQFPPAKKKKRKSWMNDRQVLIREKRGEGLKWEKG